VLESCSRRGFAVKKGIGRVWIAHCGDGAAKELQSLASIMFLHSMEEERTGGVLSNEALREG